MKKHLLIAIALAFVASNIQAQTTTYGGGSLPLESDGGYISDYSPSGTVVLVDGSVTLTSSSTYEHGNLSLQNDGIWSSQAGSTDLFVGAGNNTISGTQAPSFFNANFSNGSSAIMSVTNTAGIDITGQLQFQNGLTTTVRNNTATGAIHFTTGATYTGGTTDVQHVDGYVSKTGNTAFTFPVGSNINARLVTITAPPVTSQIAMAWFAGSPTTIVDPSDNAVHPTTSFAPPIASVSLEGFWDWMLVSGDDDGINVTVSIPFSVFLATPSDLRLVGWNGTQWINLTATPNATGNTAGSLLTGTIPPGVTISALSVGSIHTPLPVELETFTATADHCAVVLKWKSGTELGINTYNVQRSADARSFETLSQIPAKGSQSSYSYRDNARVNGVNHYRLQIMEKDGSTSFSSVKTVNLNCAASINVYPNPAEDLITVSGLNGGEEIRIYDAAGKLVKAVNASQASCRIVVSELASAVYMLDVTSNGKNVYSTKFNKR